jgi:hypothetical protein
MDVGQDVETEKPQTRNCVRFSEKFIDMAQRVIDRAVQMFGGLAVGVGSVVQQTTRWAKLRHRMLAQAVVSWSGGKNPSARPLCYCLV